MDLKNTNIHRFINIVHLRIHTNDETFLAIRTSWINPRCLIYPKQFHICLVLRPIQSFDNFRRTINLLWNSDEELKNTWTKDKILPSFIKENDCYCPIYNISTDQLQNYHPYLQVESERTLSRQSIPTDSCFRIIRTHNYLKYKTSNLKKHFTLKNLPFQYTRYFVNLIQTN